MRKLLLAVIFLISVLLILCLIVFIIKHKSNVNSIGIDQVTLTEKNIKIKGTVMASGERYRGFDLSTEGENVNLHIYTSYVSGFFPGGGDFDININGDFEKTKTVYLVDDTSKRVIWVAKEK